MSTGSQSRRIPELLVHVAGCFFGSFLGIFAAVAVLGSPLLRETPIQQPPKKRVIAPPFVPVEETGTTSSGHSRTHGEASRISDGIVSEAVQKAFTEVATDLARTSSATAEKAVSERILPLFDGDPARQSAVQRIVETEAEKYRGAVQQRLAELLRQTRDDPELKDLDRQVEDMLEEEVRPRHPKSVEENPTRKKTD